MYLASFHNKPVIHDSTYWWCLWLGSYLQTIGSCIDSHLKIKISKNLGFWQTMWAKNRFRSHIWSHAIQKHGCFTHRFSSATQDWCNLHSFFSVSPILNVNKPWIWSQSLLPVSELWPWIIGKYFYKTLWRTVKLSNDLCHNYQCSNLLVMDIHLWYYSEQHILISWSLNPSGFLCQV